MFSLLFYCAIIVDESKGLMLIFLNLMGKKDKLTIYVATRPAPGLRVISFLEGSFLHLKVNVKSLPTAYGPQTASSI